MEKQKVADLIRAERFIPVVRVATTQEALDVADALKAGGARLIEVTFTVRGALEVIRELRQKFEDEIVLGAGTVLNTESAHDALLAGAEFLVSPVLDMDVVRFAKESNRVVIPGAMTPTEILNAWRAGADMVKVFPAGRLGGPEYIKSVRGPLPDIPLVPTGGVDLKSAALYIKAGATALGIGGELVDKKAVAEKKFDRISKSTKAFIKAIREAK
ncbi:MAG: 2-dehydro-3-deoxyphosphogluconate aldolase [Deltaproteobacteria bacterium HGW-Deltaproteobacteria-15]|jgi:2-dehydro-3-deoxyphosphogluconate aldolase/(4S)-4-hydroxy-2-oxoglutarate aldolase|nr:MAG: 2-dehydro-3-deoxyphosphogluconate aldolase [Deltaproteobacteria bacterium HGW-Deltaproteobacteria-15]